MWQCHYCQCVLSKEIVNKNRLCPNCGTDLHCCKNCSLYEESLSTKCKEPESPWINDRSKQNHCPYLEFRKKEDSGHLNAANGDAEKAKEAFRALFRNL